MAWSICCNAEYDRARTVLLHQPGAELLSALLWPDASSFKEVFDSEAATSEHKQYQLYLRNQGMAVYLLGELLAGHPDLPTRASQELNYNGHPAPPNQLAIVSALGASDQIRLLIERPTLNTMSSPTRFESLELRPLPNLYFMRDQLIVTDRGVVLGQFQKQVRNGEQGIVELALSQLGIDPKYRVDGPDAVLEGGDFIPAGEWGLFGSGQRSNYCDNSNCIDHGICQLLRGPGAGALGFLKVAVIKDPKPTEQEMHLDTYFMLVSQDTCLVVETRVDPPMTSIEDRRPKVDIYKKSSTEDYNLTDRDRPFEDFLLQDLGVSSVVHLTEEDQKAYGINVLCLDTKTIVGSYSKDQDTTQKQTYEQKLSAAGISFNLLDFTNIRRGYGSNHCMSQVLIRG